MNPPRLPFIATIILATMVTMVPSSHPLYARVDGVSACAPFTMSDITLLEISAATEVEVACDVYDMETPYGDYAVANGCSGVTTSIEDLFFSGPCAGSYQRTYTASDSCGNSVQFIQIITLIDNVAPEFTITCPADTILSLDIACNADTSVETHGTAAFANVADNCQLNVEITVTHEDAISSPCQGSMVITRTFSITGQDDCGNTNTLTCDQIITVNDQIAPLISGVPADTIQDCSDPIWVPEDVTATDGCAASGYPTLVFHGTVEVDPHDGYCRTFQQRWTSEDACGNASQEVRFIHTTDDVAPQMVGEEIVELECDQWPGGLEPPLAALTEAGIVQVDENCLMDTVLIDYGVMSGGCYYDHILTYTPIDYCGNVGDSFYQIVVIHDTTDPVFVGMPADTAVSCASDFGLLDSMPTAIDNCDPEVEISFEQSILDDGDGCEETFIVERIFIAVDCGYNHARDTQYVYVVDTEAPLLVLDVPESVILEGCFSDMELGLDVLGDATAFATDDCGEVTLTSSMVETVLELCTDGEGNEGGGIVLQRTWTATATDCTGNVSTVTSSQTIEVQDNIAPQLSLPPVIEYPCANWLDGLNGVEALDAGLLTVSDNCLFDSVAVELVGQLSGSCAGTFEIMYTAVDACGNSASATQIIELYDDVPPVFISVPEDGTLACDFVPPPFEGSEAQAEDACGSVEISVFDELIDEQGCTGAALWQRTLTATDACGNSIQHTQFFQFVDAQPPAIMNYPDDLIGSCGLPPFDPMGVVAVDDCDADPIISYEDDTVAQACLNVFTVERHIRATDCSGNVGEVIQVIQDIQVDDLTPPQWTSTCGLANGEVVTLPCAGQGVLDFDPLPAPCMAEASGQCDTEVDVTRFDNVDSDAPTDDFCNICAPSDPEPFVGGLTCDGEEPETMRLFNLNDAGDVSFIIDSAEVSRFIVGCDSSIAVLLHLTDGEGGQFLLEANYEGGWDWDTWSGSGHPQAPSVEGTYKKDCAEVFPGNPAWLHWHYFVMTSGTLIGSGIYEGSNFILTHQPANAYFGFQVGLGANNKNGSYGASGWFFWDGELVVDGIPQGSMASSGDIFVDLDCCLPWEAEHNYVAEDDCGNGITFQYTISNTGDEEDGGAELSGGLQQQGGPAIIGGGSADRQPFSILGFMPNPTSDLAQLQFEVSEAQRLTIRLHTMGGAFLDDIFDGTVEPGAIYQVDVEAGSLSSGLYQLRISGGLHSEVRKLLVTQ